MSVRTSLLPVFDIIRGLLADPTSLDLRTSRVYVRLNGWNGGENALGVLAITDIEITPRPKVQELSGNKIKIGPITPSYGTGGWLPATLNPSDLVGQDHMIVIIGPAGNTIPYLPIDFDGRKPFSYYITAQQLERTKPTDGW